MCMARAWQVLTEANLSPNLVAAHPHDGAVKAALVRDTLRLVARRLANGSAWRGGGTGGGTSAEALAAVEAQELGGFRRVV